MKIDFASLQKAMEQLRVSLSFLNSPMAEKDSALRTQFRGASIQAFEYSYELAIKMIRRQLTQIVSNPQDLTQVNFADLIRLAADSGLLNNVKRFLIYRDARNRTSHTYEEETANEVVQVIPEFLVDVSFLLEQLNKRNS